MYNQAQLNFLADAIETENNNLGEFNGFGESNAAQISGSRLGVALLRKGEKVSKSVASESETDMYESIVYLLNHLDQESDLMDCYDVPADLT